MCPLHPPLAPEVLDVENRSYAKEVDIWSLGCILFCMFVAASFPNPLT